MVAQNLSYPEASELGFIPLYQSVIGFGPHPGEGHNTSGMYSEKAPVTRRTIPQRRCSMSFYQQHHSTWEMEAQALY